MDAFGASTILAMTLLTTDPVVVLPAELYYSTSDPLAVRVSFDLESGERVDWTLSRDVLQASLTAEAGGGDAFVAPAVNEFDEHVLRFSLRSPEGVALLECDAGLVRSFLEDTFRLIPAGFESQWLNIDAVIELLLAA